MGAFMYSFTNGKEYLIWQNCIHYISSAKKLIYELLIMLIINIPNNLTDQTQPTMIHRKLSTDERHNFIKLFKAEITKNLFMKHYYQNRKLAAVFPLMILLLVFISFIVKPSIFQTIGYFVTGIIAIQINFVADHMLVHSMMLYYELWNINTVAKEQGSIPLVMFYAFYYHHHTKNDNWANLSFHNKIDSYDIAVAHWHSFSLFMSHYSVHILFAIVLIRNPAYVCFLLGYEIGVLLLPISHDWVHLRLSNKYFHTLFNFFECIGIFATRSDHKAHHKHDHRTVYQSFTSSGLYSKKFDALINSIWDKMFDYAHDNDVKMYKLCGYFAVLVKFFVFSHIVLII